MIRIAFHACLCASCINEFLPGVHLARFISRGTPYILMGFWWRGSRQKSGYSDSPVRIVWDCGPRLSFICTVKDSQKSTLHLRQRKLPFCRGKGFSWYRQRVRCAVSSTMSFSRTYRSKKYERRVEGESRPWIFRHVSRQRETRYLRRSAWRELWRVKVPSVLACWMACRDDSFYHQDDIYAISVY